MCDVSFMALLARRRLLLRLKARREAECYEDTCVAPLPHTHTRKREPRRYDGRNTRKQKGQRR